MLRRLVDGCRRAVQAPALRRAFCARHVGAGATSLGIHLFAVLAVVWLSLHPGPDGIGGMPRRSATATPTSSSPVVVSAPDPQQPAQRAVVGRRDVRGPKQATQPTPESGPSDLGIRLGADFSTLPFNGFTFDVAKLTSRAAALFPFLTRRLSFDFLTKPPRRTVARSLVNPYADAPAEANRTPLVLTEAELQRLVDRSWSRRERWMPFQPIRALAEGYAAADGQLPALLRAYADQNLLQPYVEAGMRDPRIWSQLALAADHEHFVDFIMQYAAEHPSTRATMELLFVLDMVTQASLDTLLALLEVNPYQDLKWTHKTNPDAAAGFVTIQRHYLAVRTQRGLDSHRALMRHYDQIRLGILRGILRAAPDGYRASDARYLIGEIYWRQGQLGEARRVWRELQIDPRDSYVAASTSILAALRDADERRAAMPPPVPTLRGVAHAPAPPPDLEPRTINRILDAERDRWMNFSRDRLRQFGYRVDTY